ncbi:MAG: AAA family ATPase [Acidobacteriota bacterium]|nr:AAA family ATPase [Acidobacteriota bacterium]
MAGFQELIVLHEGDDIILWRGVRRNDARPVILKHPGHYDESRTCRALKNEMAILRDLNVPGVLQPVGLEDSDHDFHLLLEDFDGVVLSDWQISRNNFTAFLDMAIGLVKIIGLVHQNQVIHKNIRPDSVLVNPATGEVRLTGFHYAVRLNSETQRVSESELPAGSLAYISPEQTGRMNRKLDPRSDFYSLGLTFYEVLTGRPAYTADEPLEMIYNHIAREPESLETLDPAIPPALASVIAKLLAKTPEERYQGAYGLLKDLNELRGRDATGDTDRGFKPGRNDVSGRFILPDRLYGRDRETEILRDVYAGVQNGQCSLVLISGPAGYGKTSLVLEMEQEFVSGRACFAHGHYEQYQQNEPYTGLIQAARDLVKQILGEPDSVIAAWRRRLLEALSGPSSVLVDAVPELELVIGSGEVHDQEITGRSPDSLRLLLPELFRCFGTLERPLVLFLDDLHWSDEGTRALLDQLAGDQTKKQILIIGTWRDHEEGESATLYPYLTQLREHGAQVEHLALEALGRTSITAMIADAFSENRKRAGELAALALARTSGNPYFVREFLKRLYRDQLIVFDFNSGSWKWDPARIRETGISGTLVDLLVAGIRTLPPTTQYVLQYAGCVGNPFNLADLAIACEMNPAACADCLNGALEEGLIFRLDKGSLEEDTPSEIKYSFQHDRLQQAASYMMAPKLRQEAHLRLGRARLANWPDRVLMNRVFEVVNHFNRAVPLLTKKEDRERLAELNLEAGKRSMASRAYDAASRYLEQGFALLAGDYWQSQRELARALYLECGHCALARNRINRSRDLFESLRREGFSGMEIYHLGVMVYTALGEKQRAVFLAREGLERMGIKVPARVNRLYLWKELALLALQLRRMGGEPVETETDPIYDQQARLLLALAPAAFTKGPDFWAWVVLKSSNISLRCGRAATASLAYVMFAVLLGFEWDRWERGLYFARKGLRLSRQVYDPQIRGRVLLCYAQFYPLMDHISRAGDYFAEAMRENTQAGLVFQSGYAIMGHLAVAISDGRPLNKVKTLQRQLADRARRCRDSSEFSNLVAEWAAYLQGKPGPDNLFAARDPDLKTYFLSQDSLARFLMLRMPLDYYAGRYERILSDASMVRTVPGVVSCFHPLYPDYVLFRGLAMAAGCKPETRRQTFRAMKKPIKEMRRLAGMSPVNFEPRLELLLATRAGLRARHDEALAHYDRAARGFAEAGFLHLEALARECTGRHFYARGMLSPGRSFLADARDIWSRWGAELRVEALEEAFPELAGRSSTHSAPTSQPDLDLTTLVKASQTISQEIDLSLLLEKIMRFLLENAGAQRGLLLFREETGIVVEAEGDLGRREVRVRLGQPLEHSTGLCREVVQYVARTRESLVLEDAARIGRFMRNPYMRKHNKRSVLCLPIFHQGNITALVYLENDLIAGAFTPERLALLSVLSGQFAISLENARLYERLDEINRNLAQKVEERTRELQQANVDLTKTNQNLIRTREKLITQEKMANLGAMASGIAHEIKNPLNFIDNFAGISHEIASEISGYLEKYRQVISDKDLDDLRELLGDLLENARFINLHGARVNEIVDSMISFSVRSTNRKETYPLNDLLFEYADIAYRGRLAAAAGMQLEFRQELDPSVGKIQLVREDLGRAMVNILNNAFEAVTRGSTDTGAHMRVLLSSNNREDHVEIRVRDNGDGIPEKNRDKVFAPFFTTKANGIGLGLAIAQDIIRNTHGGNIELNLLSSGGTECVVRLPK